MNLIKYSIIIPHKNSPNLLKRCIDSIPRRNDVQIIIVDDNSDSNIVDFNNFPGLKENNIEIYFAKEDKGAGYARNVGLKHAKGKWLLFADSDDYYDNNFLNIIDENIKSDYDIIFYDIFSNDEGNCNRAKKINNDYREYFKTNNLNIIKYKNWVPWNKIISHKFIEDNKLKFEEIPVGNDAMFSLNASLKAKQVKVLPNKLYCVTYQPQSITHKRMTYERRFAYTKINIRINKFLQSINLDQYQTIVTSPNGIYQIYKEKGLKATYLYLKYIYINFSIIKSLYIWIKNKRTKYNKIE